VRDRLRLRDIELNQVDVLVLGAGPAGCAAAILLARRSHRVMLVSPETPISGSLAVSIPPSARRVLEELGALDSVDAAGLYPNLGNSVIWYPGALPGVVGVIADIDQPRDQLGLIELPRGTAVVASPYPRPIPGVPVEQNLHGISFAVANATGGIARLMNETGIAQSSDSIIDLVRSRI